MPGRLSAASYYQATAPDAPASAYPALAGGAEADVCIIGAGFAGLGTAMSLLERGRGNVLLLEAEAVGHGASGRNGGFVFGGFSLDDQSLLASAGPVAGRHLYQMTLDAVQQIRRRIERYGIDCDATSGGIYLANWFDNPRLLDARHRFMREHLGVDWRRVSRREFAYHCRSDRYFGALHEQNGFHFHPLKYAQGLARALSAGGVRIHERSRVAKIEAMPGAAGWRVATAGGEVRAREVVVCCGGYIERLYPALACAMLPIATYVMVTEPLGERLPQALTTQAAIYDTRFAFDYYRPLPDSRLLWGGRISTRQRKPQDVAKLLYADMVKVYPQLKETRIDYAWSGLMSYGRHKMPQLGRLPNGVWYAMGFGGHGVAPTALAGEVMAAALGGQKAHIQQFSTWGLPATGGRAGLLAAQLTYWYYELRDWLRQ